MARTKKGSKSKNPLVALLAGREPLRSVADAFEVTHSIHRRADVLGAASRKKNYAEKLSQALATVFANGLRPTFPGVIPTERGERQESKARTSKGYKKLDVNYSTPELGLALGVSVKTINFRDQASNRYAKNYTRVDNELRAEATDYHLRQPYAVLVAVLFLPIDACDDAGAGKGEEAGFSSLGQALRVFRSRANRAGPKDDADMVERFFIGLYDPDCEAEAVFIDVLMDRPPKARRPTPEESLTFRQVIEAIVQTYDYRNHPKVDWA